MEPASKAITGVASKGMKKILIITCVSVGLLLVTTSGIQAFRILSFLNNQEHLIKEALRAAPPGTLQSNATDGAKQFVETGELIFELSYLWNFADLKQRKMFNMRVYPRVSTHRNDGWVGMNHGNWYVKIP